MNFLKESVLFIHSKIILLTQLSQNLNQQSRFNHKILIAKSQYKLEITNLKFFKELLKNKIVVFWNEMKIN